MKGKSQGSLAAVNEAKKKHLSALRSVIKCSRLHNIDLSKLLPGWQINEKIMSMELIAVGEKMVQKRKIDETESSGRISNKEAKQSHFPNPWLDQERVINHIDSNSTLLEGGTAGHMYGYSLSPSVLHGPGGHGRTLVDSTPMQIRSHTGQLYGLHGDVAVYDRLPSHSYAYGPSSYLAGSTGLPNTKPGDAYRPPPYLEGSRGLPNAIPLMLLAGALHLTPISLIILFQQVNSTGAVACEQLMLFHLLPLLIIRPTCTLAQIVLPWVGITFNLNLPFCSIASLEVISLRSLKMRALKCLVTVELWDIFEA